MFEYHNEYKAQGDGFVYHIVVIMALGNGQYKTVYTTPWYYTKNMGLADALCWVEFHGKELEEEAEEEEELTRYVVEVECEMKNGNTTIVEVRATGFSKTEAIEAGKVFIRHNTKYSIKEGGKAKATKR